METAAEKRDFLERVCAGDQILLAELLQAELQETITIETGRSASESSTASESHSMPSGQVVADRFQILRKLGEGGMAVVYEAMDRKLGERRALKFPKAGYSQTMPPEARSALRVTHDNICRIHEIHSAVTSAGPADFISMEYLEGETLAARCRREPIPAVESLEIARQLCRGLDAAHRAHILHRDLKGNNVMLAAHADGSLRVVITDFGLARPVAQGERPASSALSGTLNYIPPERWKG
jgi:serine/threonine protein kinase